MRRLLRHHTRVMVTRDAGVLEVNKQAQACKEGSSSRRAAPCALRGAGASAGGAPTKFDYTSLEDLCKFCRLREPLVNCWSIRRRISCGKCARNEFVRALSGGAASRAASSFRSETSDYRDLPRTGRSVGPPENTTLPWFGEHSFRFIAGEVARIVLYYPHRGITINPLS